MKRSIFTKGLFLAGIMAGIIYKQQPGSGHCMAALLLTKSEQYDKAGAMLQQLIQKEPSNARNYYHLGENYLLDYYADTISNSFTLATNTAKETFQKGVNANPNDPLNYIGLAKVAVYQGDDKDS